MKLLFIILAVALIGCGEETPGSGSGGGCTSCYETTNALGQYQVVCYNKDDGICF